jgi:uncharacterized membrane protein YgcG
MNHAAISELEIDRPNEKGIVLVIDPTQAQAGLFTGYFLERFLPASVLEGILKAAEPAWSQQQWADGILNILSKLTEALKEQAQNAGAPHLPELDRHSSLDTASA